MRPVEFPGQNVVFAKNQPQYLQLPAYADETEVERPVTSCWELTSDELEMIAKTGRIWIQLLTFGLPLQPIRPSVTPPPFGPADPGLGSNPGAEGPVGEGPYLCEQCGNPIPEDKGIGGGYISEGRVCSQACYDKYCAEDDEGVPGD